MKFPIITQADFTIEAIKRELVEFDASTRGIVLIDDKVEGLAELVDELRQANTPQLTSMSEYERVYGLYLAADAEHGVYKIDPIDYPDFSLMTPADFLAAMNDLSKNETIFAHFDGNSEEIYQKTLVLTMEEQS